MIRRAAQAGFVLATLVACGRRSHGDTDRPRTTTAPRGAAQDAATLGHEIFAMVDQAVDYRGSHQGRPAASFSQMGIDSLTPTTVRRVANVDREPVVTIAFRRSEGHDIVSCRGDSSILEEVSLNGQYSLMCTTSSGAQRSMSVAADRAGATSP